MQTFHIQKQIWKKNCCNMLADSLPSQSLQTFLDWLLQRTLECVEGSVWLYHKLNLYYPEIPLLVTFFFLLLWFTLIPLPCLYTPLLLLTILGDILHCSNVFILTFSTDTMMGSGEIAFWRSIQICRFKPAERLKIFWKYACQQWKESCL